MSLERHPVVFTRRARRCAGPSVVAGPGRLRARAMRHAPITLRLTARWLAAALALLAALRRSAAAPASAATWRLEPIPDSANVAELHDLAFDAQGHGLLSWNGAQRDHVPPVFGGLATRDPAGGWQRPTDLRGIQPATMQIHLSGTANALLVAREARSATSKRRLITAEGQSDGGFDTFASLGDFAVDHWSDGNARGDAIVAWTAERSPFLRVAERRGGGPLRAAARAGGRQDGRRRDQRPRRQRARLARGHAARRARAAGRRRVEPDRALRLGRRDPGAAAVGARRAQRARRRDLGQPGPALRRGGARRRRRMAQPHARAPLRPGGRRDARRARGADRRQPRRDVRRLDRAHAQRPARGEVRARRAGRRLAPRARALARARRGARRRRRGRARRAGDHVHRPRSRPPPGPCSTPRSPRCAAAAARSAAPTG